MKRRFNRPAIANALVWAATMIATALLTESTNGTQTLILLMIAGWFTTHNLIGDSAECANRSSD